MAACRGRDTGPDWGYPYKGQLTGLESVLTIILTVRSQEIKTDWIQLTQGNERLLQD